MLAAAIPLPLCLFWRTARESSPIDVRLCFFAIGLEAKTEITESASTTGSQQRFVWYLGYLSRLFCTPPIMRAS